MDFLYGVLVQSRCIADAKLVDNSLEDHYILFSGLFINFSMQYW
jgi:hypothetical protein